MSASSSAAVGASTVHRAAFAALDTATLYALLALRVEVFVVEQRCAYRELDGRDSEPATRHLWIPGPAGSVVACLRTVLEPDGATRIGRVATATHVRGAGLAGRLLETVLADHDTTFVLAAQAPLRSWYEQFGFVIDGVGYEEDGIPHVPMRRQPGGRARPDPAATRR